MLAMNNFQFEQFLRFCLVFPVSTLSLNSFQKNENCHFQTLRTFVSDMKISWKPFSKMLVLTHFPRKQFHLCQSKICKKVTNSIFSHRQLLKVASKAFSKMLPVTIFGCKRFPTVCLTFQKTISTWSFKNWQKSKNGVFKESEH